MPHYEKDDNATSQGPGARTRTTTGAERLTSQSGSSPINTPITCEQCGSTFFYAVYAEQFAGGGYGPVEMSSLTANPIQVRICLCGNPIVPQPRTLGGSTALGNRQEFYLSAKKAKEHRSIVAAQLKKIEELEKEILDLKTTPEPKK